ncbi:MAG TPA: response regulator [Flavobacterium sp.]|nr:response regulator [Flavobacterium sp.]HPJ10819.1 response regulator [Flavobacterium sp.]
MKTTKMTIFYTDDDKEDLDFFREATESIDQNIEVVTLGGSSQLLHIIDNPPPHPHILFLDLNMPGLNGFDVLEILRSKDASQYLPIVIFSTSNDEELIRKSRELGANFYVPKSVSFESLRRSIEHAINIDWTNFIPNPQNFLYQN